MDMLTPMISLCFFHRIARLRNRSDNRRRYDVTITVDVSTLLMKIHLCRCTIDCIDGTATLAAQFSQCIPSIWKS